MIAGRLKRAWAARSKRERLLITAAALLAAACMAVAGGQALTRWRASAADRLSSASAEHQAVKSILARTRPGGSSPAPGDLAPLEGSARASAGRAGLAIALQTTAEGLAFAADDAPAPALFGWLSALEAEGATIVSLELERTQAGGVRAQGVLSSRHTRPD